MGAGASSSTTRTRGADRWRRGAPATAPPPSAAVASLPPAAHEGASPGLARTAPSGRSPGAPAARGPTPAPAWRPDCRRPATVPAATRLRRTIPRSPARERHRRPSGEKTSGHGAARETRRSRRTRPPAGGRMRLPAPREMVSRRARAPQWSPRDRTTPIETADGARPPGRAPPPPPRRSRGSDARGTPPAPGTHRVRTPGRARRANPGVPPGSPGGGDAPAAAGARRTNPAAGPTPATSGRTGAAGRRGASHGPATGSTRARVPAARIRAHTPHSAPPPGTGPTARTRSRGIAADHGTGSGGSRLDRIPRLRPEPAPDARSTAASEPAATPPRSRRRSRRRRPLRARDTSR